MAVDFVAPSAGAVLVLQNSIVLRHWCVEGVGEVDAIAFVPRIEGEGPGICFGWGVVLAGRHVVPLLYAQYTHVLV
jgi:hypothetical protein